MYAPSLHGRRARNVHVAHVAARSRARASFISAARTRTSVHARVRYIAAGTVQPLVAP